LVANLLVAIKRLLETVNDPAGDREKVAAAVAFLASPAAAYITGTTLNADGGFNA
jgi:NAD(P)-dependent dehydrogenase (short-subunit alcohol dehydrogenase family)